MKCVSCSGEMVWQNDFSYDDYCIGGDGIVSVYFCNECGCMANFYIPLEED